MVSAFLWWQRQLQTAIYNAAMPFLFLLTWSGVWIYLLFYCKQESKLASHLRMLHYIQSLKLKKKKTQIPKQEKLLPNTERLQNTEKWRQFSLIHQNGDASNDSYDRRQHPLNFHHFNKRKSLNFKLKGGALSSTHPKVTHCCRLYGKK